MTTRTHLLTHDHALLCRHRMGRIIVISCVFLSWQLADLASTEIELGLLIIFILFIRSNEIHEAMLAPVTLAVTSTH